jgi:hypothetical protein
LGDVQSIALIPGEPFLERADMQFKQVVVVIVKIGGTSLPRYARAIRTHFDAAGGEPLHTAVELIIGQRNGWAIAQSIASIPGEPFLERADMQFKQVVS